MQDIANSADDILSVTNELFESSIKCTSYETVRIQPLGMLASFFGLSTSTMPLENPTIGIRMCKELQTSDFRSKAEEMLSILAGVFSQGQVGRRLQLGSPTTSPTSGPTTEVRVVSVGFRDPCPRRICQTLTFDLLFSIRSAQQPT